MERTTVRVGRVTNALPASAPSRVLVVDPDADTRTLYKTASPLAGCEVIEAFDGRGRTVRMAMPPTETTKTNVEPL
jgi:hypothetical protein